MSRHWSSPLALGLVLAALLAAPATAHAQFIYYRPGPASFYGPSYGGYGMNYPTWAGANRYFGAAPYGGYYGGGMYNPGYGGLYPYGGLSNPGYAQNQVVMPGWAASNLDPLPRMRATLGPAVPVPVTFAADAVPNQGGAVLLEVRVPAADAEVWVQGAKTSQTGLFREYTSPPLTGAGPFTYTVEVRWTANGQPRGESRNLSVRPGQRVLVDFTTK